MGESPGDRSPLRKMGGFIRRVFSDLTAALMQSKADAEANQGTWLV